MKEIIKDMLHLMIYETNLDYLDFDNNNLHLWFVSLGVIIGIISGLIILIKQIKEDSDDIGELVAKILGFIFSPFIGVFAGIMVYIFMPLILLFIIVYSMAKLIAHIN